MLRKVFVPLLAALLAVVPSRTGSAFEVIEIAYDESVSADLSSDQTPGHATDLGLLGAGSHAVLLNDSEGNPSDRDHFTFEVGAGNELTEFRLSDYTHSDFGSNAAITLGTGQNPFQGSTVEAII